MATYPVEVLADAPLSYYRLGGSTVYESDLGSAGSTGTCSGGVTRGAASLLSNGFDGASSFDGTDDKISCGTGRVTTSFSTVEAWVKTAGAGAGSRSVVDVAGFLVIDLVDNVPRFNFKTTAGGWTQALGPSAINDNQRHHLVGVYDTTAVRLYLDGVEVASTAATTRNNVSGTFLIGSAASSGFFAGVIDEVAAYGTALSSTRVAAHYAAGSSTAANPSPGQVEAVYAEALTVNADAAGQVGSVYAEALAPINLGIPDAMLGPTSGNDGMLGSWQATGVAQAFRLTEAKTVRSIRVRRAGTGSTVVENIQVGFTTTAPVVGSDPTSWVGGSPTVCPIGAYSNPGEQVIELAAPVSLAANTDYWLVIKTVNIWGIDNFSAYLAAQNTADIVATNGMTMPTGGWRHRRKDGVGPLDYTADDTTKSLIFQLGVDPVLPSTGYPGRVVASSPTGYWLLNETTGTTMADSSGNGRVGTYSGATLGQTPLHADSTASALGGVTGQGVGSIPAASLGTTEALTASFWVKFGNTGDAKGLVGRVSPVDFKGWTVWQRAGRIGLTVLNSAGQQDRYGPTFSAGQVAHVAVIQGGGFIQLLVDGVEVMTASIAGTYASMASAPIQIGGYGGSNYSSATFSDVAYWDRALTPDDIYRHVFGGSAVAATDPATVSGLKARYDALAITGLSDGAQVATWSDTSGNGKHATQATSGNRPIYKTGIYNGHPVVRFDGSAQTLAAPAVFAAPDPAVTVIAVYTIRAHNNLRVPWSLQTSNTGIAAAVNASGQRAIFGVGAFINYVGGTMTAGTFETQTIVARDTYNGASGGAHNGTLMRVNGAVTQTDAWIGTGGGGNVLHIGQSSSQGFLANADVAELLVFDRPLHAREIRSIELYLQQKWEGSGVIPETTGTLPLTVGVTATVQENIASGQLGLTVGLTCSTVEKIEIPQTSGTLPLTTGLDSTAYGVTTGAELGLSVSASSTEHGITTGVAGLWLGLQSDAVLVPITTGTLPLTGSLSSNEQGITGGQLPLTAGASGAAIGVATGLLGLSLGFSMRDAGVAIAGLPIDLGQQVQTAGAATVGLAVTVEAPSQAAGAVGGSLALTVSALDSGLHLVRTSTSTLSAEGTLTVTVTRRVVSDLSGVGQLLSTMGQHNTLTSVLAGTGTLTTSFDVVVVELAVSTEGFGTLLAHLSQSLAADITVWFAGPVTESRDATGPAAGVGTGHGPYLENDYGFGGPED